MILYLQREQLFENFCALQSTSIYIAAHMTENRVIKIRVAGPEFYLSEDPCVHEKFDKSKWVMLFQSYRNTILLRPNFLQNIAVYLTI